MLRQIKTWFFLVCCLSAQMVCAESLSTELEQIEKKWTEARFYLQAPQNESAIGKLISKVDALVSQHPDNPQVLFWASTIYVEKARIDGGLSGLKYVNQAKRWYERCIELDPKGVQGQAQAFLGALYDKVPGWPVSFGDSDKAYQYLVAALKIAPKDVEFHTFLGDFFVGENNAKSARYHLQKALSLPLRQDNPKRDQGRKRQAALLLQQIEAKKE